MATPPVVPLVRSLVAPLVQTGGAGPSPTPASLFSDGQAGYWPAGFDPAGGRMLQTYPGDTFANAADQPVALAIDMSRGGSAGPELLVNTDFSDGDTGWVLGTGMLVIDGQLHIENAPSGQLARQEISASANRLFVIDWTLTSHTGGQPPAAAFGTSTAGRVGPQRTDPGRYIEYGIGSGTPNRFGVRAYNSTTAVVARISCREVPGVHAFQPTALNRPVLSQSGNGVWHLYRDGDDSLPVILPVGDYQVAYADIDGAISYTTLASDGSTGINTLMAERLADVIIRAGAGEFVGADRDLINTYWGGLYG